MEIGTILVEKTCSMVLFIILIIEINGICVWRCKKEFSYKYLFHQCTGSSWSLQNLIACFFMQALAKYTSFFYLDALKCCYSRWRHAVTVHRQGMTWVTKSCTLPFGIRLLNVPRMSHCVSFSTAGLEEVAMRTCGVVII
jgi:hypothetical protein